MCTRLLLHLITLNDIHTHARPRYDSSGRVISPTQRDLPDNTEYTRTQETHIHAPAGFEGTIPASERPQTYALDCIVIGISMLYLHWPIIIGL